MKQVYLLCLLFFSLNFFAQTRIARIDSKKINNVDIINSRRIQTKKAQREIDRLSMESKRVGKAILPMLYSYKSKKLMLNGAGLREMLWLDLYACGLYLGEKNINPSKIVSINRSMVIRLDILSNAISKKKLIKAFKQGFGKSNSGQTVKKYKSELNQFISFLDVDVNIGDKYDIIYTPGVGTSLYVNYKKKGTIQGLDFKSAIFNMWLSETPADKSLRKELLGIK